MIKCSRMWIKTRIQIYMPLKAICFRCTAFGCAFYPIHHLVSNPARAIGVKCFSVSESLPIYSVGHIDFSYWKLQDLFMGTAALFRKWFHL